MKWAKYKKLYHSSKLSKHDCYHVNYQFKSRSIYYGLMCFKNNLLETYLKLYIGNISQPAWSFWLTFEHIFQNLMTFQDQTHDLVCAVLHSWYSVAVWAIPTLAFFIADTPQVSCM